MSADKGAKKGTGRILGRDRFGRISAVEGLRLSFAARQEFDDDDEKKLTPRQRRARIIAKYTKAS